MRRSLEPYRGPVILQLRVMGPNHHADAVWSDTLQCWFNDPPSAPEPSPELEKLRYLPARCQEDVEMWEPQDDAGVS